MRNHHSSFLVIAIILMLMSLISCGKSSCDKFINEIYSVEVDSNIMGILEYMPRLYDSLDISRIDTTKFEKYRIISFSTLRRTTEILEMNNRIDHQEVWYKKIYRGSDYSEMTIEKDTMFEISNSEWRKIEDEFYKYKFWTADQYKERITTDGWGFIIEGIRPIAAQCNKRTSQLVFRGSPSLNDEMRLMYNNLDSLTRIKN